MCASAETAAPEGSRRAYSNEAAMAIDETPSSFFAPWPDRLRHSAIILLAAGLGLVVLVTLGLFVVPVGATIMQGPAIVASLLGK